MMSSDFHKHLCSDPTTRTGHSLNSRGGRENSKISSFGWIYIISHIIPHIISHIISHYLWDPISKPTPIGRWDPYQLRLSESFDSRNGKFQLWGYNNPVHDLLHCPTPLLLTRPVNKAFHDKHVHCQPITHTIDRRHEIRTPLEMGWGPKRGTSVIIGPLRKHYKWLLQVLSLF